MAVYTKINKGDISFINKQFGIEEIISFQGIKKGIENLLFPQYQIVYL